MYQTCLVKQQVQSKLDAFCCTTDHELKNSWNRYIVRSNWLRVSFLNSFAVTWDQLQPLESESVEAMGATSVRFWCCFGVIQLVLSITTLALGVHLQDHCPADERIPYFMIGMLSLQGLRGLTSGGPSDWPNRTISWRQSSQLVTKCSHALLILGN